MALFGSVLTKMFGSKYDRDMKEIQPMVDKIKAVYPVIEKMTNDGLREKTNQIRQRIAEFVKAEETSLASLK
jgi:preprotein translocase subunit SecA